MRKPPLCPTTAQLHQHQRRKAQNEVQQRQKGTTGTPLQSHKNGKQETLGTRVVACDSIAAGPDGAELRIMNTSITDETMTMPHDPLPGVLVESHKRELLSSLWSLHSVCPACECIVATMSGWLYVHRIVWAVKATVQVSAVENPEFQLEKGSERLAAV